MCEQKMNGILLGNPIQKIPGLNLFLSLRQHLHLARARARRHRAALRLVLVLVVEVLHGDVVARHAALAIIPTSPTTIPSAGAVMSSPLQMSRDWVFAPLTETAPR